MGRMLTLYNAAVAVAVVSPVENRRRRGTEKKPRNDEMLLYVRLASSPSVAIRRNSEQNERRRAGEDKSMSQTHSGQSLRSSSSRMFRVSFPIVSQFYRICVQPQT